MQSFIPSLYYDWTFFLISICSDWLCFRAQVSYQGSLSFPEDGTVAEPDPRSAIRSRSHGKVQGVFFLFRLIELRLWLRADQGGAGGGGEKGNGTVQALLRTATLCPEYKEHTQVTYFNTLLNTPVSGFQHPCLFQGLATTSPARRPHHRRSFGRLGPTALSTETVLPPPPRRAPPETEAIETMWSTRHSSSTTPRAGRTTPRP